MYEKRIAECVFDLTTIAFEIGIFETDIDSRMVFEEIYELAREFETRFQWIEELAKISHTLEPDYMTEIESYGYEKLTGFMRRFE